MWHGSALALTERRNPPFFFTHAQGVACEICGHVGKTVRPAPPPAHVPRAFHLSARVFANDTAVPPQDKPLRLFPLRAVRLPAPLRHGADGCAARTPQTSALAPRYSAHGTCCRVHVPAHRFCAAGRLPARHGVSTAAAAGDTGDQGPCHRSESIGDKTSSALVSNAPKQSPGPAICVVPVRGCYFGALCAVRCAVAVLARAREGVQRCPERGGRGTAQKARGGRGEAGWSNHAPQYAPFQRERRCHGSLRTVFLPLCCVAFLSCACFLLLLKPARCRRRTATTVPRAPHTRLAPRTVSPTSTTRQMPPCIS